MDENVRKKLSKWINEYYVKNAEVFTKVEEYIPDALPQEIKDYFFALGKCSAIEDLLIEMETLADEKEGKVTLKGKTTH